MRENTKKKWYHILLAGKTMVVGHDDILNKVSYHKMSLKCESKDGVLLKMKVADYTYFKSLGLFNVLSVSE